MNTNIENISPSKHVSEKTAENTIYEPILVHTKNYEISSVFDCSHKMNHYAGNIDYHSLMHNVQKPDLTLNKVDALSFFANKILLIEWVKDLVPIQETYTYSSSLNDESEIKRLFQLVFAKVKNREEFIIKPINGSESIGTLKAFRYKSKLKAEFLGSSNERDPLFSAHQVITDFQTFSHWIKEDILGVTSGHIDTHLRHIDSGLTIQALFPHDKSQQGPTEMKFNTAWGELLYVGCRNAQNICLGNKGEHLEGDRQMAQILKEQFFEKLKKTALALARASTFPNLRIDFFVDINSGQWVLNEIETLADCRSYPHYILENTGKFYLNGWINKAYRISNFSLTIPRLRERLTNELQA
ncbi:MAG: hypothetical protein OQL19_13765 [Gammaproteobacteria bacterium]|nr:hypothetical protein [Gammaproteobacteria bacterium]